jgi:hypothetical protein
VTFPARFALEVRGVPWEGSFDCMLVDSPRCGQSSGHEEDGRHAEVWFDFTRSFHAAGRGRLLLGPPRDGSWPGRVSLDGAEGRIEFPGEATRRGQDLVLRDNHHEAVFRGVIFSDVEDGR